MNNSPPGGPQGWGGQQGWGGNGWGGGSWVPPVPPAPKPGVVPLRPLSLGELLEGAFATMRRYWRTFIGVSLAVAAGTQVVETAITRPWLGKLQDLQSLQEQGKTVSVKELLNALGGTFGGLAVTGLIGLAGSIVATAMFTAVVSRAVLGRPMTAREAWQEARPRLAGMAGLLVVVPLLIGGVVLACLLPGLIIAAAGTEAAGVPFILLGLLAGAVLAVMLWIRYSLATPVLMLEKQGVIDSMRRSAKLVRGSWGRIFGVTIVSSFLVFVFSSMVQIPGGLIQTIFTKDATSWPAMIITGIGAIVASTIALPFMASVTTLLYTDQRIRRESLDLELARAAGAGGNA
ncbi:glycerophosphoryl diester phosphodiesterase membrane domain-containing protein [Streptoverticillium reticulum]|uniref:glycerophosphoryl diester phosphodiesterase membrane domain-containing protein n=1 Tax=Streptoverticillium reticulum TaxID=1433415 RepID=UPI0039BF78E1